MFGADRDAILGYSNKPCKRSNGKTSCLTHGKKNTLRLCKEVVPRLRDQMSAEWRLLRQPSRTLGAAHDSGNVTTTTALPEARPTSWGRALDPFWYGVPSRSPENGDCHRTCDKSDGCGVDLGKDSSTSASCEMELMEDSIFGIICANGEFEWLFNPRNHLCFSGAPPRVPCDA